MVLIERNNNNNNNKDDEPNLIYSNSSIDIYNLLQDLKRSKIIIDTRSKEEFDKQHIRTAVNIEPPSPFGISERDNDGNVWIKNFDLTSYISSNPRSKLWCVLFSKLVIYSDRKFIELQDNQQQLQSTSTSTPTLHSIESGDIINFKLSDWDNVLLKYFIIKKKKTKVMVYQGDNGFSSFQYQYPFMCNSSDVKVVEPMYPSEIIDSFLYLGGQSNSEIRKQIQNLKITHIVNMASELEDSYPHIYKYYRADLDDTPKADIYQHFEPIIQFINNAKQEGGRVLVHCAMGISRSASAVIAYLIKENQMTFSSAFKFVKSKRSFINPNFGFVDQLKEFESDLKSNSKVISKSISTKISILKLGIDNNN